MKKLLLIAFGTLLFVLTGTNVSAATQITSYNNVTVPRRSQILVGPNKANYTYKYALDRQSSKTDDAAIHLYYACTYNGSNIKISPEVEISEKGSYTVLFRPVSVTTKPSSYSINATTSCSGGNTSDSACALANSTYYLYMENINFLHAFTTSGQFIFTD